MQLSVRSVRVKRVDGELRLPIIGLRLASILARSTHRRERVDKVHHPA